LQIGPFADGLVCRVLHLYPKTITLYDNFSPTRGDKYLFTRPWPSTSRRRGSERTGSIRRCSMGTGLPSALRSADNRNSRELTWGYTDLAGACGRIRATLKQRAVCCVAVAGEISVPWFLASSEDYLRTRPMSGEGSRFFTGTFDLLSQIAAFLNTGTEMEWNKEAY
jgi:hypothetical protein